MRSVNESCEYNLARKNMIIGEAAPLIRITAPSCVSSFLIYRADFGDPLLIFQQALALFAVVVVEGVLPGSPPDLESGTCREKSWPTHCPHRRHRLFPSTTMV